MGENAAGKQSRRLREAQVVHAARENVYFQ